mgnify:CR=1 FL=1
MTSRQGRQAIAATAAMGVAVALALPTAAFAQSATQGKETATTTSSGTTYYVSSAHGDDANAGTSENAPWKSLTKVNDIVDHAGVGRNTFYYHFEDKYDLVNWYFQSGITQFLVERGAYTSWDSLLAAIKDYFLENKVFYCNALAYNGQNSLQQYMFDYLRSIFEQNARELNPDISASETRAIGQFFSGALMGILIPWVLGGMRTNGLVISDLTIPVFNPDILQKLLRGDT